LHPASIRREDGRIIQMNKFLATVVAAGFLAAAGFGAEIKSGPEVGKGITPFNPLNVTGPDAGEKTCPV
jgi:hypothetical protein